MSAWRVSCDAANPRLKCSCREYYEVSDTSNTDLSKKMCFSKRAKMKCIMEVGSGINQNLEFRRLSSKNSKDLRVFICIKIPRHTAIVGF